MIGRKSGAVVELFWTYRNDTEVQNARRPEKRNEADKNNETDETDGRTDDEPRAKDVSRGAVYHLHAQAVYPHLFFVAIYLFFLGFICWFICFFGGRLQKNR